MIQVIILPRPLPFKDEDLPFDKESVVFYSFVLETLRRLVNCSFEDYFVELLVGDQENNLDMDFELTSGHDEVVGDVIYGVLNKTVYDYIVQMKSVKQNAIQNRELEKISIKKKIPEDIEKQISAFANYKKSNRKTTKKKINLLFGSTYKLL